VPSAPEYPFIEAWIQALPAAFPVHRAALQALAHMGMAGLTNQACYVWQVRAYLGNETTLWSGWTTWGGPNSSDSPFSG
jgi:hypothetical protein